VGIGLRVGSPGHLVCRVGLALVATIVAVLALADAAPAATRIIAVGDVGRGGAPQERFGAAVRRFESSNAADLLITLGDNDYTDSPAAFRENWRTSFGWLRRAGVDVAGALGDHDVEGPDDGSFELEVLGMPGPYYSRVAGDVEVFVLDASSRSRATDEEQRSWLEQALAASTARWKIAVVHRPPYTCGRYRGSPEVQTAFVPLFEQYGVQLVLSGDDHNYQRFEPENGVTYIVDGAGNDRLYPLESCPALYPRRLAQSTQRGFLYLVASEQKLDGYQVAMGGVRLDHFTLHASPTESGGDVGYRGPSYDGARLSPSGSKPESKLWWNDGAWWGSLFDTRSGDFHIFRLDEARQRWIDTGTRLDPRIASRADTLWDGTHLYVASHVTHEVSRRGEPSRLYRFSYDSASRTYSLDPGFPTRINDLSTETLVIDRDSTGTVWATWVSRGRVYVNRTVDRTDRWGSPFVLPANGVEVGPDISSVIAFGGDRIGVFWGNHKTGNFYFAVHEDGRPAGEWGRSEVISELGSADDHVNLKADSTGRVYAAVKTSATAESDTLIALLARDPGTGSWSVHTVGTVFEDFTRAICLVDETQGVVFVYTTQPIGDAHEGAIQVKVAPLGTLVFEPGVGIPAIRDVRATDMSDVTSTKQLVSPVTGVVVLASNNLTRRYWHSYTSLETSPLVAEAQEAEAVAQSASLPEESTSARELLSKAAPALLVAFGLPLWLLAYAAVRANKGLALVSTYGLTLIAVASGVSLALAALLL